MTRLGDRAYRLILSVFPRQFRRRYGVDMIEQFSRQRRGVRGRPLAAVSLWCRAGADALGHGLALRLAGSRAPSGTAPAGSPRVSLRRGIPRRIELQQALRALRRSPWYSLTVVAVITLSTALSATVFAIVDGVLFKPLPYADAGNLYRASARRGARGGGVFKLDEITAWRDAIPELQFTAIQLRRDGGTLGDGRMYGAVSVDENFFSVLGHAPLAGGFTLDHFRPGGTPVAIISYRLWHGSLREAGTPSAGCCRLSGPATRSAARFHRRSSWGFCLAISCSRTSRMKLRMSSGRWRSPPRRGRDETTARHRRSFGCLPTCRLRICKRDSMPRYERFSRPERRRNASWTACRCGRSRNWLRHLPGASRGSHSWRRP